MSQGRGGLHGRRSQRAARCSPTPSPCGPRGKALADVPPSTFVDAEAERLDELRLAALKRPSRRTLAAIAPASPSPTCAGCSPISRSKKSCGCCSFAPSTGRAGAEALGAYEQARTVIADQLGVDPGPEMQQAFQRLLSGEVAQPPAGTEEKPRSAPSRRTVPAKRDKRTPAPSGDPADAQVIRP